MARGRTRARARYNRRVSSIQPSIETIPATTHGRFLVRDAVADAPRAGLLVGFHGYAQTADAFLADLESIPGTDSWVLVSIQGLHRFYTKAGDVVAHWMTSQDRELAITDNVAYVRAVVQRVRDTLDPPEHHGVNLPLVFLGFSQGVAMAFRAAAYLDACRGVLALGGDIPPEVRGSHARLPPVLLARGADDEWYSREKFDVDRGWLNGQHIHTTVCEFDGGHAWSEVFRREAGAFLARVPVAR